MYAFLYHNLLNTDVPIWQEILDTFRFGIVFDHSEYLSEEKINCAFAEIVRSHTN